MVTATRPIDNYGADPVGRQISNWISKIDAGGPALTGADYVGLLLAHANATPETLEGLPKVKAGVLAPGEPEVRGQQWPASKKAAWIADWRDTLSKIVEDRPAAIKRLAPELLEKLNNNVLLIPHFSLVGEEFKTSFRFAQPLTELTLSYALLLLLDSKQPFGQLLSQCKHRECGKFFLAVRKHQHGKLRRDYCTQDHFDDEQRMKVAERVREHRRKKAAAPRKPK